MFLRGGSMRRILLLIIGFGGGLLAATILLQSTVHALETDKTAVQLPCQVEQTPIRILSFQSYDGPYIEDGSGDDVENIASVVLENTGRHTLRNGAIKLLQGRQVLVFSFTMLPPGDKILVMEKSRKPYSSQQIVSCWGWSLNHTPDRNIRIEEYSRSGFLVTNNGQQITSTSICFKSYDSQKDMFIGGYTYRINVSDLKPGIAKVVPMYRYIRGAYRIVD